MSVPELVLDPSLRVWVLFPILFVMILVGVIRHYATVLLQQTPKSQDAKTLREQQFLQYSQTLRANGVNIRPDSFAMRQNHLIENMKNNAYLADPKSATADTTQQAANMLQDPKALENMMNGMKGQISMVVPQTLMMGWINAFFAGFVLMRLPFPLTIRFKEMLQSGVATTDLDVRWVSSLSWYFLNLLGLNSVYALILGGSNSAGGVGNVSPNPGAMPGMQRPGTETVKMYRAEAENLHIARHEYLLEGVEDRVLNTYLARPKSVK
uniref:ER membrane protein complex subunit 3 n=1 Tax=Blastobotrys adeninivorans TaxID=409370 RepID=A0A060T0E3_BLAAD